MQHLHCHFGAIVGSVAVGIIAGKYVYKEWIPDDIYLPMFSITAEEIFSNKLALFDVNFFKPKEFTKMVEVEGTISWEKKQIYKNSVTAKKENEASYPKWIQLCNGTTNMEIANIYINDQDNNNEMTAQKLATYNWSKYIGDPASNPNGVADLGDLKSGNEGWKFVFDEINRQAKGDNVPTITKDYLVIGKAYAIKDSNGNYSKFVKTLKLLEGSKIRYTIEYSHPSIGSDWHSLVPSEIKITREAGSTKALMKEEQEVPSTAKLLSRVIAKWYFILRNLALLVLMIALIYSGIKIVIGSTAGEKAKYKERLIDWIIAMCLVFMMHYIMIFALELVEKITDLVTEVAGTNGNAAIIALTDKQYDSAQKIINGQGYGYTKSDIENIGSLETMDGENVLTWKTDLAGLFRIQAQMTDEGTAKWAGYSLCYVVLVLFTLFFSWTYLKRIAYMAFLTMIAPLVAMTYPIDKITDGKAQAFDSWLKEYIFNLMIQPLHLLLYAILVSSAYELATSSPVYALVSIGFMMPAEKLLRRFFGFEKAKTPGLLGGAAGAAIAMTGLQSLMRPKHHGGKGGGDNSKSKDTNNVKFANKNSINTMEAVAGGKGTKSSTTSLSIGSNSSSSGNAGNGEPSDGDLGNKGIREQTNPITVGAGDITTPGGNVPLDNSTLGNFAPISTFEQTKAARAAYSDANFKNFDIEGAAKERKRRIKAATGAALSSAGRQLAGKALTGIHPMRLAGKIATGAVGATAGLMLGVASGDPNAAFKYATAGAVGGSALAESLSGNQVLDVQQIKDETEMAYYGSDYKQKVIDDQRKEFQKANSNINYLRQTMGVAEEEAREILDTTGGRCFDNGITSIEDVATIHKLTSGEDSISFNQAVAARNYAKKRLPSDPDQMSDKSIEQHKARWVKEYREAGYANAEELGEKSFDLAIRYNKAQSSLTKM